MIKVNKLGALILSGVLMCSAPTAVMASEGITASIESLIDSGVDAVFSNPDQIVDVIMYVKEKIDQQDVSDDQIRSVIDEAAGAFQISLTDAEKDSLLQAAKKVKDADINEEELRSDVNAVFDKLGELGVEKEEVKGFLQKLVDFAKGLLN